MRRLMKKERAGIASCLTAEEQHQLGEAMQVVQEHGEHAPYFSLPYSVAELHRMFQAIAATPRLQAVSLTCFRAHRPHNVRGARKEICVCPECQVGEKAKKKFMSYHHSCPDVDKCLAGKCAVAKTVAREVKAFDRALHKRVQRLTKQGPVPRGAIDRESWKMLAQRQAAAREELIEHSHTESEEFAGVKFKEREKNALIKARPHHTQKLLAEAVATFKLYRAHLDVKRRQATSCKADEANLKPGELLILIDYASRIPVSQCL